MLATTSTDRYTVVWSPAHKLWFVYDRLHGGYVDHSATKQGALRMAVRLSRLLEPEDETCYLP